MCVLVLGGSGGQLNTKQLIMLQLKTRTGGAGGREGGCGEGRGGGDLTFDFTHSSKSATTETFASFLGLQQLQTGLTNTQLITLLHSLNVV